MVLLLALLLFAAGVTSQPPPHSFSWYSGDIAAVVDAARQNGEALEASYELYLIDALKANANRWSYVESQVFENTEIDLRSVVGGSCIFYSQQFNGCYDRIWFKNRYRIWPSP